MKDVQIGTVTMEYDENGKVVLANFIPDMVVELDGSLARQLWSIAQSDAVALQNNADLVFASWFSKMNEIELADREKYSISSQIEYCEKYLTGNVKKCVLKYTFKSIVQ